MMATTHALVGVALAAVTVYVAPEHAPVAASAAFAGGLFPDLDLYAGHRRTLHFPVYYSALVPGALALLVVAPGTATIALAFFVLAAAAHSSMDVLGGGLELKPWLGQSDRAVYDHFRGQWVAPRRWIRYDGSPEDLVLAALVALPSLVLFEAPVATLVTLALSVSIVYAVLRKRLVTVAERVVPRLPDRLLGHVPERFVDDLT